MPDDALAFLAHTALQPPMAVDGDAGSGAGVGQEFDLDVDDADEEPLKETCAPQFEGSGPYKGAVERNIYNYGDLFTVKVTRLGQQHSLGSFSTVEEARAARDAALSGLLSDVHEQRMELPGATAELFINTENRGAGGEECGASATELTQTAE
jgi:hypothetical protein